MIKTFHGETEVPIDIYKYPAGEIGYKISNSISKIICWFENSDDLIASKLLSDHFPEAQIIFPYLPFSREDRRVSHNASYGLFTLENLFNGRTVRTFDIHSYSRDFYNIEPFDIVDDIAEDLQPDAFIFPDEGAASRYSNFTQGEEVCHGVKERNLQTGEIISYKLNNEPKGNKILVIDDICDGGRTFIELAKLLPDKELYLYVSHGIFSKGFDELKKYYKHIYTTDSYKGARDNEFVTEYRCI